MLRMGLEPQLLLPYPLLVQLLSMRLLQWLVRLALLKKTLYRIPALNFPKTIWAQCPEAGIGLPDVAGLTCYTMCKVCSTLLSFSEYIWIKEVKLMCCGWGWNRGCFSGWGGGCCFGGWNRGCCGGWRGGCGW